MRIISSFKDYYDYALAWADEEGALVYQRETKYLESPPNPFKKFFGGNTFVLGFCGKIYAGLAYQTDNWETQYMYGEDALRRITENTEQYVRQYPKMRNAYKRVGKAFEALMNLPDNFLEETYQTHYTPVFYLLDNSLIINPCLKELQFQQVMEGSQAFQAIEQFLFGVLVAPENPTLSVSNEDKIIKHGFDTKWSFRKESTDKKR